MNSLIHILPIIAPNMFHSNINRLQYYLLAQQYQNFMNNLPPDTPYTPHPKNTPPHMHKPKDQLPSHLYVQYPHSLSLSHTPPTSESICSQCYTDTHSQHLMCHWCAVETDNQWFIGRWRSAGTRGGCIYSRSRWRIGVCLWGGSSRSLAGKWCFIGPRGSWASRCRIWKEGIAFLLSGGSLSSWPGTNHMDPKEISELYPSRSQVCMHRFRGMRIGLDRSLGLSNSLACIRHQ